MIFCTDVDLLHWEPQVFSDALLAAQQLMSATGNLAGTSFTIGTGSFTASRIEKDQVISLAGPVTGTFPIFAVNSATALTLSVLYDGLSPDDGSAGSAMSPGSGTGIAFAIRTFWPQRKVVSDLLKHAAGLGPTTDAAENSAVILNPSVLRRACVLGTLQMIYNTLAATIPSDNVTPYGARSQTYAKLYRQAIGAAKVEVDLNGDGVADEVRSLNVLRFVRM